MRTISDLPSPSSFLSLITHNSRQLMMVEDQKGKREGGVYFRILPIAWERVIGKQRYFWWSDQWRGRREVRMRRRLHRVVRESFLEGHSSVLWASLIFNIAFYQRALPPSHSHCLHNQNSFCLGKKTEKFLVFIYPSNILHSNPKRCTSYIILLNIFREKRAGGEFGCTKHPWREERRKGENDERMMRGWR